MLNKESIVNLLKTNDRAVARALVVLNERQTHDEQVTENTRYLNGRGFRPCHARMGTSMAKFVQRNGYLSPKQISYWRALDKAGSMRIGIYWKQLIDAAEEKKNQQKTMTDRDLGNDMERRLILVELSNEITDPIDLEKIKNQIEEIDTFWAKIRGNK